MKIIYFDFETTDKRSVEIVSIGAIELDSLSSLELLIVPAEGILSPEASRINGGITMDRLEHLYKHEDAFLPEDGLRRFMDFISSQRKRLENPMVLCAHNNFLFHAKVLVNNLRRFKVPIPRNVFLMDSIDIMTEIKQQSKDHTNDFY